MKLNQKIRYLLDPESGMRWEYDPTFQKLTTDTRSYQDDIKIYCHDKDWIYHDRFLGGIKLSFLTKMKIKKALAGSNVTNVKLK